EYAEEIKQKLIEKNIRVKVDDRNEKVGFKIREAEIQKSPYMIIVGEKEVVNKNISVRKRKEGDLGQLEIEDFINKLQKENTEKTLN
ncbi:threonine--tRNA ligase, partial [candidate division KSB1 bacterium]|nr:threonine--tRNA ligase [candidate division KSB1 bacterium]